MAAKKAVADKSKRTAAKKNSPVPAATGKPNYKNDGREKIFALDIGTRSVIGIVAEKEPDGTLAVIATSREEHKTRAMLDGQIHDVPQVAAVIEIVRDALAEEVGELKSVAVAAAGRALYTMTATAEMEIRGAITEDQQKNLDFTGVQLAQAQIARSKTVPEQANYYCVGFSVISYELDGIRLKSLIGQRGKIAKAKVIATFLPRQVIDSMQIALSYANLEMHALTLEPIAAINVLIPLTMRHLNLVLVDIGAGTSDIAITKNGSVIAYGMVPIAGDEITETLSQKFLLDFNVAEEIKLKATRGENAQFTDILGSEHDLSAEEIISAFAETTANLANEISRTILELNGGDIPQAVMLVGGGSLTPNLQKNIAAAIGMQESRVGIRRPYNVEGITNLPRELCAPDAVTPLGILKIATINTLHFLNVYINDVEYALFHFQELNVGDALLNAGVQLRKFNGKPGLGLMITIDGERKFFPGSMGTIAKLTANGKPATLETPIKNGCHIKIEQGTDGEAPAVKIEDAVKNLPRMNIFLNGKPQTVSAEITVNGEISPPERLLQDGDDIKVTEIKTLGDILRRAGLSPSGRKIRYSLNGRDSRYTCTPKILVNDSEVNISQQIRDGDQIEYYANDTPKISDILKNIVGLGSAVKIFYGGSEFEIPATTNIELTINERPATLNTFVNDDAVITYDKTARKSVTVSDALLAVDFKPPDPKSRMGVEIKVNGTPADFASPMTNGDTLEVILKSPDGTIISSDNSVEIPAKFRGITALSNTNLSLKDGVANAPVPKRKLTIQDFIRND